MNVRAGLGVGGLVLAATMLGCSTSEPNGDCASNGSSATVTMTAGGFSPNAVTVTQNQSVCWQNSTSVVHNVTADDGSSFAGLLDLNGNYTHTFGVAGFFGYHCSLHAGEVGMVTVEGPQPPLSPPRLGGSPVRSPSRARSNKAP